jgi:hypothetical protein
MKKFIIFCFSSLVINSAIAQDLVATNTKKVEVNIGGELVHSNYNFEVSNAIKNTTNTNSANIVQPNYSKLWIATTNASQQVKLKSNFEGRVKLSYIITNNSGQVMATKEVNLAVGQQALDIAMQEYPEGNYFITANIKSKETKAQSNFTFNVTKKNI